MKNKINKVVLIYFFVIIIAIILGFLSNLTAKFLASNWVGVSRDGSSSSFVGVSYYSGFHIINALAIIAVIAATVYLIKNLNGKLKWIAICIAILFVLLFPYRYSFIIGCFGGPSGFVLSSLIFTY